MSTFADTSDAVLLDPVTQAPVVGAHCTVWTADPTTGTGTQITGLTAPDGTSLPGYVTSDADGRIPYKTVDEFRNTFLQDPSGNVYRFRSKEAYDTTDDYLDQFPGVQADASQASSDAAGAVTQAASAVTTVNAIKPDGGAKAVGKDELIVRVEDHGAVGDGVTDDTAAFTDAMTFAVAHGGGVVQAKGIYKAGQFTVRGGTTLDGLGSGVITRTGTASAIFLLMESGSKVRNLTVDGGGALTTGGALWLSPGTSKVLIENNYLKNMTTVSAALVQVSSATEVTIRGNTMDSCGMGVQVLNSSQYVRIENNRVKNHLQRGIYVVGSASGSPSDIDIVGNIVTDLVGGASNVRAMIQCLGGAGRLTRISIRGNRVLGPQKAATVDGSIDQINCSGIDGLTIVNNTSWYGGDCGISGSLNTRVLILGNDCQFNDTTGIAAGGAAGSTASTQILGNICMNNGQNRNHDRTFAGSQGIYIFNGHGVIVSDNNCGDSQGTHTQMRGILVGGASDNVLIRGNQAVGVVTDLYWDDNTPTNVDFQDSRGAATPTAGKWVRGAVIKHSAPTAGGFLGWVCVSPGGSAAATWAASTAYSVGDRVTTTTGRVYYCTTAGTSGTAEPVASGSFGSTFLDGTVTWVYFSLATAVFKTFGTIGA